MNFICDLLMGQKISEQSEPNVFCVGRYLLDLRSISKILFVLDAAKLAMMQRNRLCYVFVVCLLFSLFNPLYSF